MYALYDTKAEIYDTPIFMLNEATAKRWFYTLCQKGEGRFEYFQNEIKLHRICKFNVITGKLYEIKIKSIMDGKQIMKEVDLTQEEPATIEDLRNSVKIQKGE